MTTLDENTDSTDGEQSGMHHLEKRHVNIVTAQQPITLGTLELKCAVGQLAHAPEHYVELWIGKSLHHVFGGKYTGNHIDIEVLGPSSDTTEKAYLPRFLAAKGLRPFITPAMYPHFTPYTYKVNGITAYAYHVDILRDICVIYSQASRKSKEPLFPQQEQIVNQAIDLLEALAGVGLQALVQEKTGCYLGNLHQSLQKELLEKPVRRKSRKPAVYDEKAYNLLARMQPDTQWNPEAPHKRGGESPKLIGEFYQASYGKPIMATAKTRVREYLGQSGKLYTAFPEERFTHRKLVWLGILLGVNSKEDYRQRLQLAKESGTFEPPSTLQPSQSPEHYRAQLDLFHAQRTSGEEAG